MYFLKTSFNGDTNLGLYGFATDKYCLLGFSGKKVKHVLKVPIYPCKILNIDMAGIFVAGNSHGIVINDVVEDYNIKSLQRYFDNILILKTKYTAVGNLIMMNDNGAIISPLIKKHRKEIEEFFGISCAVSTIAKQKIVGNLGIATNKGCLLHPKVRAKEKEIIEKILTVSCDIGTVNFGSMYPGAGLLVNSNGFVTSEKTSGPEMGRITEALGFL